MVEEQLQVQHLTWLTLVVTQATLLLVQLTKEVQVLLLAMEVVLLVTTSMEAQLWEEEATQQLEQVPPTLLTAQPDLAREQPVEQLPVTVAEWEE